MRLIKDHFYVYILVVLVVHLPLRIIPISAQDDTYTTHTAWFNHLSVTIPANWYFAERDDLFIGISPSQSALDMFVNNEDSATSDAPLLGIGIDRVTTVFPFSLRDQTSYSSKTLQYPGRSIGLFWLDNETILNATDSAFCVYQLGQADANPLKTIEFDIHIWAVDVVVTDQQIWVAQAKGVPSPDYQDTIEVYTWNSTENDLETRVTLEMGEHSIEDIALHPDGTMLVAGDTDGYVMGWELTVGKQLFIEQAHRSFASSIVFNNKGDYFATAGNMDGTIIVWDADTQEIRQIISYNQEPFIIKIGDIAFDSESQFIGVANDTLIASIVDIHSAERVAELSAPVTSSIVFSPDNQWLVTDEKLWQITSHDPFTVEPAIDLLPLFSYVSQLAFSADSTYLAIAAEESIQVFDMADQSSVATFSPCLSTSDKAE